jgi:hypothetical protein
MSNWYVDNSVVSSGDGHAWATAWKDLSDIWWGGMSAGDTIYISGGASGQTYAEQFSVVWPVASEASRITIRCGQDSGHTGRVTITKGIRMGDNGSNRGSYVTINGEYAGTRNIYVSTDGTQEAGVYYRFTSTLGNKFFYLDVEAQLGTSQVNGFDLNSNADATEIAFCKIHDVGTSEQTSGSSRAIREGGGACTAYGRLSFHDNYIGPNVAGDGLGCDGGCDFYNNIVDGTGCNNVLHSDGIQGVGSYWRIYNNIIFGHGQEIFIETVVTPFSNVLIYNNLIYTPAGASITSPGIYLRCKSAGWDAEHPQVDPVWSNIVIANNVFEGLLLAALRISVDSGPLVISSSQLTNNIFANNSGGNITMSQNGEGTVTWSSGGFYWKNNTFFNGQTTTWQSTSYATVAALQSAQADATGNLTSDPLFTDAAAHDYRLSVGSPDTGAGIDLHDYFTTDFAGAARTTPWDIGAYKYETTGPSAPSSLTATAISTSVIGLGWTNNDATANGILVERSTDGTNYAQIASLGPTDTAYSATGLASGTQYWFRVRCYNESGNSAYSNADDATTGGLPVGYIVERSVDGVNGWTQIADVAYPTKTFDDATANIYASQYYRIKAYNSGGESVYCSPVGLIGSGNAVGSLCAGFC